MNTRDLTGQRFEHLTALYPLRERRANYIVWMCRCDCGAMKAIPSTDLTRHRVKSCGCLKHRAKDIAGERRGHLTALRFTGQRDEKGHALYEWQCDCGNVFVRSISGTARETARMCPECLRQFKARQMEETRRKRNVEASTGLTGQYLRNLVRGVLNANNTSGVRGVYWHEGHQRWVATGRVGGRLVNLGEFEEIAEAREARREYVEKAYGSAALALGIEMP